MKNFKNWLLAALLAGAISIIPFLANADPGYLWMEPGREMSRMREGGGAQAASPRASHTSDPSRTRPQETPPHGRSQADSNANSGHPSGDVQTHGKGTSSHSAEQTADGKKTGEKKQPRVRRAAMSHPAHYLLKLGAPAARIDSDDALLDVRASVLTPELKVSALSPARQAGRGVSIRDEALIQGRYDLAASLVRTEDGVRYHLFTQTTMRNTGHKPKETKTSPENARAAHRAFFAIEDRRPDPGHNFARVHRTYTGDALPVRIWFDKRPLPGVSVTLETESGWRRTIVTDERGDATLPLIKEKFHTSGVDKKPLRYFIMTEIRQPTADASGDIREEVYRTSLVEQVYPSPLDWESKSAGLYLVSLTIAAVGVAAALRRRRRKRLCA